MDFAWTEDQLLLREQALTFAQRRLAEGTLDNDREMRFPREKWDQLADWGFFRLGIPETYGGEGLDHLSALAVMEGLAEGCDDLGLLFSAVTQLWVTSTAILRFGSDEQKRQYLPKLASGSCIGAFAVTEANSGSDAFAMQAKATSVDGGWEINGEKKWVSNGPIADLIICFARTGKVAALGGVTAFIVDTSLSRIERGPPYQKMGLRTSPVGDLSFAGTFVPERNILGKIGSGGHVFHETLEWERIYAMSIYVGALERQLRRSISYAKERKTFGTVISKHQGVANKIVDMALRLETSRLLLYKAIWTKSHGRPAALEAAMAKLSLSECAVANSLDAIQLHGAYGYSVEMEVERDLRDAVASRLHSGTSEIQRLIIANGLGL